MWKQKRNDLEGLITKNPNKQTVYTKNCQTKETTKGMHVVDKGTESLIMDLTKQPPIQYVEFPQNSLEECLGFRAVGFR